MGKYMSNLNTEQKLQVVQQIRSQYAKNKYDMQNRERILYNYPVKYPVRDCSAEAKEISTLKIRILVTVILVILVIGLDVLNVKPKGLDMEKVFQMIGENCFENFKRTII